MISKLNSVLTKRDKKFLLILVAFSIIISLIEVVGVSAIMPFITVATDFNVIHTNQYFLYFYELFQIKKDIHFVMLFGVILICFYIMRSIINIFYTYLLARFSQGRYYLIAYRLFENYMGMSYKNFVKKNSSYLTKAIVTEAASLTGLMSAALFMMSEIFIVIFIYGMMLFVNYKITIALTIFLIINATLMMKTVSKRIKKQGEIRAVVHKFFYEVINKSFANFKLIKLQSNDNMVLKDFKNASYSFSKTKITAQTLSQVPRLFLESISFSLIILIVLYLVWEYENNISAVLSMLSMFVLALYRLMPSVNRILSNYNNILFSYKSLEIIHNELMYDSENLGKKEISFDNEINISNLYFRYDDKKDVIKNISFSIKKGEKVAFIGESGSGKSTLVDIIIGLYKPTSGLLKIDNNLLDDSNVQSWRSKIGYIPQSVYLFDGTVGDNVSFGNKYDKNKIIKCLKQANIHEFLNTKEAELTLVGEGGIMLSGGQKQRIAIARALYGNPEILVLDEATSALDDETETKIMDEIYETSKNKTLIIIAHRLSTIKKCDTIYRLQDGRVNE